MASARKPKEKTALPAWASPELIRALPKSDLHVHLDGSLRPGTLIELARERRVRLPAWSEEGLLRKVFRERYRSLPEYLQGFGLTCAVLQDAEALERAAWELCLDGQEEGVRYLEIRFAPQLHAHPGLSLEEVLRAVGRGIERAEKRFNRRSAVRRGEEPPFRAGIVVCAMRFFLPAFSRHYADLCSVLSELPRDQVFGIASEALVRASIRARDEAGVPVVGVDLAGQEKGYPAADHARAYQLAHEAFLGKTVHAGEDYGPESIFQAITVCHADRIGHGTWLFSAGRVSREVGNRREYVRRLVEFIADRRITLEVCLTSNLQTLPALGGLRRHPFRRMLRERLSASLCTDNRLVSRTTVSREWERALAAFRLSPKQAADLLVYGFKRSFFPGSYREKRAYVRQVLDYRDRVLEAHGVSL